MEKCDREYSIIMLKPDCIQRKLNPVIMNKIMASDIAVIKEKTLNLKPEEIKKYFLHPTKEYIDYLSGGAVKMYLVQGYGSHEKLYELKKMIRQEACVENSIYNLIHTTDQGNEYHNLLDHFFPELEQINYCNQVDENLVYGNTENFTQFIKKIEYLDKKSPLKYCAINIGNMKIESIKEFIKNATWVGLRIIFNFDIKIQSSNFWLSALIFFNNTEYLNNQFLRFRNAVLTKDDLNVLKSEYHLFVFINDLFINRSELESYRYIVMNSKEKIDETIKGNELFQQLDKLKGNCITGCICFRPDFVLLETEYRMDICRLLELQQGGGSAGMKEPGYFSVSLNCLSNGMKSFFLDTTIISERN